MSRPKIIKKKGKLFITCLNCGKLRETRTQNLYQIKRCIECEYEHRRQKNTIYKNKIYKQNEKTKKRSDNSQ